MPIYFYFAEWDRLPRCVMLPWWVTTDWITYGIYIWHKNESKMFCFYVLQFSFHGNVFLTLNKIEKFGIKNIKSPLKPSDCNFCDNSRGHSFGEIQASEMCHRCACLINIYKATNLTCKFYFFLLFLFAW